MKETYWDQYEEQCVKKPAGIKTDKAGTTLESMELESGYFRFSFTSPYVYPCKNENCVGSELMNTTDSFCAKASFGPLCALCENGHYVDWQSSMCTRCSEGGVRTFYIFLGAVVVALLLLKLVVTKNQRRRFAQWRIAYGDELRQLVRGYRSVCAMITCES